MNDMQQRFPRRRYFSGTAGLARLWIGFGATSDGGDLATVLIARVFVDAPFNRSREPVESVEPWT